MSDYVGKLWNEFRNVRWPLPKRNEFAKWRSKFYGFLYRRKRGNCGTPKTFKETLDATLTNSLVKSIDYESFRKLDEELGVLIVPMAVPNG